MSRLVTLVRGAYHNGWLLPGPLLVFAGVAIWPMPWLDGTTPDPSLLTSIAQALGAILALLFTISLIVAQMSSDYSPRLLPGFFDVWFRLYLLLFVVSVALPYWMTAQPAGWLVTNHPVIVLKITLSLGAACLLLLMPFLFHLRDMMDPEAAIRGMRKAATKSLRRLQHANPEAVRELRQLKAIDEIMMNALRRRDYGTLSTGFDMLLEMGGDRAYTGRSHAVRDGILGLIDDVADVINFEGDPRARRVVRVVEDKLLSNALESSADRSEAKAQQDDDTE